MPRSRNDPLKRKCAQALNHQAAAILDVNEVFLKITEQVEMLTRVASETESQSFKATEGETNPDIIASLKEGVDLANKNLERYKTYAEDLRKIMLGVNATREHLLLVVNTLWGLDEESIQVYMG